MKTINEKSAWKITLEIIEPGVIEITQKGYSIYLGTEERVDGLIKALEELKTQIH